MKLIVKADDIGFTHGINLGILKSHVEGIVKSAGLMVNMQYSKEAVRLVSEYPTLCLGLHCNLVIGKPCADENLVKGLLQDDGTFISSKTSREKIKMGLDPISSYDEAYIEVEAQIKAFYHLTGKLPEYLEGHAIRSETLNKVYHDLAIKYNLLHISFIDSLSVNTCVQPIRCNSIYPWYEANENNDPSDFFTTNAIGIDGINYGLLVMHPGYMDYEICQLSSYNAVRTKDLYALCSDKTKQWINEKNVTLINHRDILKF